MMFPVVVSLSVLFSLDTAAIQKGLDESAQTGKPFVLPEGEHLSGTLRLKSGAHLRFASGAALKMLPDNASFAPVEKLSYDPKADLESSRFEHALLFIGEAEGVVIDGPGLIACARTGRGGPKAISMRNAKRVRVEGITIADAPNYAISMIGSRGVVVSKVKIERALADGIDVDSSEDVTIADVYVDSYDDAICLKASLSLNKKLTTRNVTVERATLTTDSVYFKIGTETYGNFRNIVARNLKLVGRGGNRHGNPGVMLATVDGGSIRGVTIRDVEMDGVGAPFFLRIGDRSKTGTGEMSGVLFERVRARGNRGASVFAGLADNPIRNVRLKDVEVDAVPTGGPLNEKQAVPERREVYPEVIQFGPIPASVLYGRHLVDLKLEGFVHRNATAPAILLDSVLRFKGKCNEVAGVRLACR